jgi:hypothetical protein
MPVLNDGYHESMQKLRYEAMKDRAIAPDSFAWTLAAGKEPAKQVKNTVQPHKSRAISFRLNGQHSDASQDEELTVRVIRVANFEELSLQMPRNFTIFDLKIMVARLKHLQPWCGICCTCVRVSCAFSTCAQLQDVHTFADFAITAGGCTSWLVAFCYKTMSG